MSMLLTPSQITIIGYYTNNGKNNLSEIKANIIACLNQVDMHIGYAIIEHEHPDIVCHLNQPHHHFVIWPSIELPDPQNVIRNIKNHIVTNILRPVKGHGTYEVHVNFRFSTHLCNYITRMYSPQSRLNSTALFDFISENKRKHSTFQTNIAELHTEYNKIQLIE